MGNNKIVQIVVIIVIAIIAIVGIVCIDKVTKDDVGIEYYTGVVNKEFENKLINNYNELKRFTRELALETIRKNHQNYNVLEIYNEEFFQTKKLAVIGIYEDNSSDYDYQVDKINYNENKTTATIEYTNKSSGYNGSLVSSWTNILMIELEGTVTSVNFVEVNE